MSRMLEKALLCNISLFLAYLCWPNINTNSAPSPLLKPKEWQYIMQENSEQKGMWRAPESKKSWEGVLKINNRTEIALELEGCFGENDNSFEVMLGEANDGEKITIVNLNKHGSIVYPKTGKETRTFDCEFVLIGKHFSKFEDIKFKRVYLNPTHITEWLLPSKTFSNDVFNKKSEDEKEDVYCIRDKGMKKEIVLKSLNSKLIFNLELRFFGDLQKTCEFIYQSYIIIESEEPKKLDWFLDLNHSLCDFLTLMVRHPVYSNVLGGDIGDDSIVEICFVSEQEISKKISMHDIDIKFSDLNYFQGRSYVELCLNNWFEKRESLNSVCEIFHMISYIPVWHQEAYFIAVMQALEAFYGYAYSDHKYLKNKGDWRKIRDELIKSIPNDLDENLKESIENKIRYGNEYSLKTKIKILFDKLSLILKIYGDFGDDKINKICDTRDYFTHHDNDYVEKILANEEINEVNKILKILLKILILMEIGIPESIIWDLYIIKIRWLKYYYKKTF